MLRNYIESLHKHVEQENKARDLVKQQEVERLQTMQPVVKPLGQQLVRFFRSLSETQIDRAWSLSEIALQLDGKYRDHPHPQNVAAELYKAGWARRRVYGAGGGKRMWFPPTR